MRTRVSVTIVTYNTRQFIEPCLESVLGQGHPVEVVVVDNVSMDGTRGILARYEDRIRVIYNNRNSNVIYRSPTDQTIVNSQYLADGTLDPTRLQPKNAGFGAATSAQPLRNSQLQIRFGF